MPRSSRSLSLLLLLAASVAVPLAAQTQIGGGTCSSATLTGPYAFSLTGRQVTPAGDFTSVLQGNGSATFDGLNAVKIALTADTAQASGISLSLTGTYSLQSNCAGQIIITSGGSETFNIVLFGQGASFLITGSDSTYSYSGSGNNQPTVCSTAVLSGVYVFNATGYSLSGSTVNGISDGAGLFQFDGKGALTANFTLASTGKSSSFTGTYSIGSNCLGSASLNSTTAGNYTLTFAVTNGNATATTDFYVTLAQSTKAIFSGAGHSVYGQPTAAAFRTLRRVENSIIRRTL